MEMSKVWRTPTLATNRPVPSLRGRILRESMSRITETCPTCGYTSPYVRVAEHICPSCYAHRMILLAEARKQAFAEAKAENQERARAERAHRTGRRHNADFCIMCQATQPYEGIQRPILELFEK